MRNGGYKMIEDCISMERLEELKEANTRRWLLVCELLLKKQKLRTQLSAEGQSSRATPPISITGQPALLGSRELVQEFFRAPTCHTSRSSAGNGRG